jgi:hypothetical protein
VGLDPFAKFGVFQPGARHHRDEAAAGAVDIVHVVAAAQLRVGDVEEIGSAGHVAQRVPSLDVGLRVIGVAVGAAKLHRHTAIVGERQDEDELFQIGPMILRETIGDRRGGTPPKRAPRCGPVLTAEAHRGRIVVHLIETQRELAPDREHDVGQ